MALNLHKYDKYFSIDRNLSVECSSIFHLFKEGELYLIKSSTELSVVKIIFPINSMQRLCQAVQTEFLASRMAASLFHVKVGVFDQMEHFI